MAIVLVGNRIEAGQQVRYIDGNLVTSLHAGMYRLQYNCAVAIHYSNDDVCGGRQHNVCVKQIIGRIRINACRAIFFHGNKHRLANFLHTGLPVW